MGKPTLDTLKPGDILHIDMWQREAVMDALGDKATFTDICIFACICILVMKNEHHTAFEEMKRLGALCGVGARAAGDSVKKLIDCGLLIELPPLECTRIKCLIPNLEHRTVQQAICKPKE